jgi:hypothetical protein
LDERRAAQGFLSTISAAIRISLNLNQKIQPVERRRRGDRRAADGRRPDHNSGDRLSKPYEGGAR